MKNILITGCSSGFGLDTANYFLERGWKVIATMRKPREGLFPKSDNLRVLALDVTKEESIRKVMDAAGPIDVLVNNAGIGLMNALEGSSLQSIREVFETNTFGTMAMIQAVLPQFRRQKAGVIVNVSSSTTLKSIPLLSVYTASKAAVNAFTECLAIELEPFNVRVRIVIPGRSPETPFAQTAMARISIPEAYADFAKKIFSAREQAASAPVTYARDVSEAVWLAVTEPSSPMRIPAGADAVEWSK